MSPSSYPGDAAVEDQAGQKCAAEFAAHVAHQATIDFDMLTPTADSWTIDRTVWCYLYDSNGAKITTSLYVPSR